MFTKGTPKRITTSLTHGQNADPNTHLKGVGYLRVSTTEQAEEGVSLDAQREKISAYCSLFHIELIQVYADEGLSGSTLKRPGLRNALSRLERDEANVLIVCKLDRLTRALGDLDQLVRRYFLDDAGLLSVSESFDTRSAMGRMCMNMICMFAQWEREAISERTREAMQHLKSKGVLLGSVPYGMRRLAETDADGRRLIVPDEQAQAMIAKILESFDLRRSVRSICRELNQSSVPSPRGGAWHPNVVIGLLERHGRQARRVIQRTPREYRPDKARAVARQLRSESLSLRFIARRLEEMDLRPKHGGNWLASSVSALLQSEEKTDVEACRTRARQLRASGLTLRAVATQLWSEGYRPSRATRWHAATVADLLSQCGA